jgi:hypothetical protein
VGGWEGLTDIDVHIDERSTTGRTKGRKQIRGDLGSSASQLDSSSRGQDYGVIKSLQTRTRRRVEKE